MQAVVETVAGLTTAVLLSLSQWFSEGVTAYNKGNHQEAVAAFTKVVEHKSKTNPFLNVALYWRAQSYAALKKTDEAGADLAALLKGPPDDELTALAFADYKTLTGKAWEDTDLSSPESAWKSLCFAIRNRDPQAVLRCCTGRMAKDLGDQIRKPGEHFWEEGDREVVGARIIALKYNKNRDSASLSIQAKEGRDRVEKILMRRIKDKWMFAGEVERDAEGEFDGAAEVAPRNPDVKPVSIAPQEEKQIQLLVDQLGDASAKNRADAYSKLKALGARARTLLQKAAGNPDPEVAVQAKKLLSEM